MLRKLMMDWGLSRLLRNPEDEPQIGGDLAVTGTCVVPMQLRVIQVSTSHSNHPTQTTCHRLLASRGRAGKQSIRHLHAPWVFGTSGKLEEFRWNLP